MLRSASAFIACLTLASSALAAPYETLKCHSVIEQDFAVTSEGGTTTVKMHAAGSAALPLLRHLLPTERDTLLRAYGCVEFDLAFPDASCAFAGSDESLATCTNNSASTFQLRAKLSCYDFNTAWDTYDVSATRTKVQTRHVTRSGNIYLQADYTIAAHDQIGTWNSSDFELQYWDYDGITQAPECTIDRAPLIRN